MNTPKTPQKNHPWGALLTLVGVGVCATAGFWQLDRAGEKRALEALFRAGSAAPKGQQLLPSGAALNQPYSPLVLRGYYRNDRQVLLDNLSYRGVAGYQVLTPFITSRGAVLVNRGWVPAAGDRRVLPEIKVSSQPREIQGRISLLPRPGIGLAPTQMPASGAWPRRLLFPTSQEMGAQSGLALRDYQLLMDSETADGYLRDWQPGGMGPERHLAYAVQWFSLALTVVVIYLVLIFRNRTPRP